MSWHSANGAIGYLGVMARLNLGIAVPFLCYRIEPDLFTLSYTLYLFFPVDEQGWFANSKARSDAS